MLSPAGKISAERASRQRGVKAQRGEWAKESQGYQTGVALTWISGWGQITEGFAGQPWDMWTSLFTSLLTPAHKG